MSLQLASLNLLLLFCGAFTSAVCFIWCQAKATKLHCSIFFFFSHHTVCSGLNQLMTQQHKSCENSHITHWPLVSWNLFSSTALRLSRINIQEHSNKTEICTHFPAADSSLISPDQAGIMFSPQNQLLQRVWPALSVHPCATVAPTPAQVN